MEIRKCALREVIFFLVKNMRGQNTAEKYQNKTDLQEFDQRGHNAII